MNVHVTIKALNNPGYRKEINFEVDPNETIEAIKRRIFDQTGIPTDKQVLAPATNTVMLNDQLTLQNYGQQMQNSVHFVLRTKNPLTRQIFVVTTTGENIMMDVAPDCIIENIKAKLQPLVNIPKDHQRLFFADLDNSSTLRQCKIPHCGTLYLSQTITLNVISLIGKLLRIQVGPRTTVYQLKVKIDDKESIPPDSQCLVFKGRKLEDGRTLHDYGIEHDSRIDVTF